MSKMGDLGSGHGALWVLGGELWPVKDDEKRIACIDGGVDPDDVRRAALHLTQKLVLGLILPLISPWLTSVLDI